jgi:hypothetical protein
MNTADDELATSAVPVADLIGDDRSPVDRATEDDSRNRSAGSRRGEPEEER